MKKLFLFIALFVLAPVHGPLADDFLLSPKQIKIQQFLKANYCESEEFPGGQEPDGMDVNEAESEDSEGEVETAEFDDPGEENFCLVKRHIQINPEIKVLADDKIEVTPPSPDSPEEKFVWREIRKGKVPDGVRQAVYKKLLAIQMPQEDLDKTLFQVWKINLGKDFYENYLVHAFHKRLEIESELKGDRCEMTLALSKKTRHDPQYAVSIFNKIPHKEVDFEIDSDIQKSLYDVRDVDGDKKLEIILFAEGYEASWLEVYSRKSQGWYLAYKGLGYSF